MELTQENVDKIQDKISKLIKEVSSFGDAVDVENQTALDSCYDLLEEAHSALNDFEEDKEDDVEEEDGNVEDTE